MDMTMVLGMRKVILWTDALSLRKGKGNDSGFQAEGLLHSFYDLTP
jgi:hypothetical protein